MNDIDALQDRIAELEYALREMYESRVNTKTLRDEFAMAVMHGYISNPDLGCTKSDAKWCYDMADAMIKAREVENND